jgi:hypothetical protein
VETPTTATFTIHQWTDLDKGLRSYGTSPPQVQQSFHRDLRIDLDNGT